MNLKLNLKIKQWDKVINLKIYKNIQKIKITMNIKNIVKMTFALIKKIRKRIKFLIVMSKIKMNLHIIQKNCIMILKAMMLKAKHKKIWKTIKHYK